MQYIKGVFELSETITEKGVHLQYICDLALVRVCLAIFGFAEENTTSNDGCPFGKAGAES